MTKDELVKLLDSVGCVVNEGVTATKNEDVYPRIVFWDYLWEDQTASGKNYTTQETYQISFFAKDARHPYLLALRDKLREKELFPVISHEYVEGKDNESGTFHSYFQLDVTVE